MAHQPRPPPPEENHVGTTSRTKGSQIRAQTDLRLTCGAPQYPAAASGFAEPILSNSSMSPHYFPLDGAPQVEGAFSAPDSHSYLGFNEGIPTPIGHPPSASPDDLRRHAENHHHQHHQPPYDPRLFDVGASFVVPTTSPRPRAPRPTTTNSAHDTVAYQHALSWHNPSSNNEYQNGSQAFASMPTAPGISSFEPMITTLGRNGTPHAGIAPPLATTPAYPGGSPSGAAAQSPGINSFSNARLDVRFEQVSPSGGRRGKSSTKKSSRDQPAAPSKRTKPVTETTRKKPPAKNTKISVKDNDSYNNKNNSTINASPVLVDDSVSPKEQGPYYSPESPAQGGGGDGGENVQVPDTYNDKASSSSSSSLSSNLADVQDFLARRPPPVGTQRERNRTAATKCRAKTKVVEARLEATERTMWEENMQLSAQVAELRGQVLALKNELLHHGYCDCELIQRYIRSEAIKIGVGAGINETVVLTGHYNNNHSTGQQYPLQHLLTQDELLGGRAEAFRNDSASSMTPATMTTTTTTPSMATPSPSSHFA